MRARKTTALVMMLACLVGLAPGVRAADAITVKIAPPAVETRVFDPSDPPAEMPQLTPEEAAVTNSAFGVQSSLEALVGNERSQNGRAISTLKVEGVEVDVSLTITIWLPQGAPRELVAHEEGHRRISEQFYRDAERVARGLAQKYVGQSITGQGADAESARRAAMNKLIHEINGAYMAAIQMPSAEVNAIFDKITVHGRNGKISVDQAIRQATQQYEQGRQKKQPVSAATKGS